MMEATPALQPAEFCQSLLRALEASEGRSRRRRRDQTPDAIGLAIKRDLLERAADDKPTAEAFESWLVAQVLSAPAGGPVRALCAEVLDEYRLAALDPDFAHWLQEGAPSEDAEPGHGRAGQCACPPMDLLGG